jgi:hypothetical protein
MARLDARRPFPKLYSYTMARKILHSVLPNILIPDAPLSHPDSALYEGLESLLQMGQGYRWTLRASQVIEAISAKIGGSSEHFPFAGLKQFLEWGCPKVWLGKIQRSVWPRCDNDPTP